jgi:hypothetical protein
MTRPHRKGIISIVLCIGTAVLALAQKADPSRISFRRGSSGARVKGSLSGRQDAEYLINAKHGQTLSLVLVSSPVGSVEPSVLDPKNKVLAIKRVGSQRWIIAIPEDGDYGLMVRRIRKQDPASIYTLDLAIR